MKNSDEVSRRYHEMLALMRRAKDAWYRDEFAEGELIQDVLSEVDSYLGYEDLEAEISEQAFVPISKRATGRTIPDLTGMEHVCEWQKQVAAKAKS